MKGVQPIPKVQWTELTAREADRVRVLCSTERHFVLLHTDIGRSDPVEAGSKLWYDPLTQRLYREYAYQDRPSTWRMAPLPQLPETGEEDDE